MFRTKVASIIAGAILSTSGIASAQSGYYGGHGRWRTCEPGDASCDSRWSNHDERGRYQDERGRPPEGDGYYRSDNRDYAWLDKVDVRNGRRHEAPPAYPY